MNTPLLQIQAVSKCFTLHHQHGAQLRVLDHVDLELHAGECLVLDGPSGMGKSTLLKLIYANYRASGGRIMVRQADGSALDIVQASARELYALRRDTIGYVSQFLRVIPRVPAIDVVAEPLLGEGAQTSAQVASAREQAGQWLTRLRIPERLWPLPPSTFSGGEQQRINIARSLIKPRPLLLLDEPTASLDKANTRTVIELIDEARRQGAGLLGIFHDPSLAEAVATRRVAMSDFRLSDGSLTQNTAKPALHGEPA
jgi:alpha-D-ribose 1-methylphosphonate 5-triphosphate synthase subunit PhnL